MRIIGNMMPWSKLEIVINKTKPAKAGFVLFSDFLHYTSEAFRIVFC